MFKIIQILEFLRIPGNTDIILEQKFENTEKLFPTLL